MLLLLMLTYAFGPSVVGMYALAAQALRMPFALGAQTSRRVFLQRSTRMHNERQAITGPYFKLVGGLFLLAIPPLVFVLFFADHLFGFVYCGTASWMVVGVPGFLGGVQCGGFLGGS